MTALRNQRPVDEIPVRPSLKLVSTPAAARSTWHGRDEQRHKLRLTFAELALVYKSLQTVKTLAVLQPQDELLNDTLEIVDRALSAAV
jgi:hypothetical protein